MNLFTKQTHRHQKQTNGYQRERVGRDKIGIWDQQIHTTVYKIDNHQGPTVQAPLSFYIYRGPSRVCVYLYVH